MRFENVTVEISEGRWDIRIIITLPNGEVKTYIASADGSFTYSDGIWFGTQEEYEDWI